MIGAVGPGLKPRSRPPMISVMQSSCVTVKFWPLVTVTKPVNSSIVPTMPSSIRLASVPGVFSTMLKAEPFDSQVPTLTLVPKKFIGELTSNTTSGVVNGTLAGTALNVTASGTCQRLPVMTLA